TKLNKQLKANFNKFSHINASFCEVKACINVTLGFGTFLLSLDTTKQAVKICHHLQPEAPSFN
ncbi:hypothetical protein, partial [Carnobacterium mobile]